MKNKTDKGVAGLEILLSLIVMLFVIGLIVTVFSLMSGEIGDTDILYETSSTISVASETVTQANLPTGDALTVAGLRDVSCTITSINNGSATGTLLGAGNYTESAECTVRNLTSTYVTANWFVNYTYTYSLDESGAIGTINDTTVAIASVTDWYDIFIVIGAMVVLILLTVIIIVAIRGSGATLGSESGERNVGTA